jgi:hypothetical protein
MNRLNLRLWVTFTWGFYGGVSPLWAMQCFTPPACDLKINSGLLSKSTVDRTHAIQDCLTHLATKFPKDTSLYTYGHREKIQTLQTYSLKNRWEYQRAFQNKREMRMILELIFKERGKVIELATQLSKDNYDLYDLLKAYHDHKQRNNGLTPDLEATAFALASFSKIYPDLLNELNSKELEQVPENSTATPRPSFFQSVFRPSVTLANPLLSFDFEANEIPTSPERAKTEGSDLAEEVQPGFDSTAGNGTYLSENPTQSLDHFTHEGDGLACRPPRGKVLIDLDNFCVKNALTRAHIYISEQTLDKKDLFIMRPQGKNLYVSPLDFEKAAEGFVIAFRPSKLMDTEPHYYVEKKAMEFGITKNKCHLITIRDFSNCADFKKLMEFAHFPEALRARPGFLHDFHAVSEKCSNKHVSD